PGCSVVTWVRRRPPTNDVRGSPSISQPSASEMMTTTSRPGPSRRVTRADPCSANPWYAVTRPARAAAGRRRITMRGHYQAARIRSAYGHEAAAGLRRRRRAAQLQPGGRAARRHAAGGEPPGTGAREAARDAAARPLGAARRAHRSGAAAVPRRAAPARARGGDHDRGHERRGGRPLRHVRDRCVVRPGRRRLATAAVRVREASPGPEHRAHGERHADDRRARGRADARTRHRRRCATTPRRGVRAVLPRRARARLPARPSLRRPPHQRRRPARRDGDPHAGRRRRARGDRGRAADAGRPPQGSRRAPRARIAGVGRERGSRRLRRRRHLAHGDRGGPRRGHARRSPARRARGRAGDLARARRRPLRDARRARVRRVRAGTAGLIVRWGLDELPSVLGEAGIERPFLIANERWSSLDLPQVARWTEVPSHRVEMAEGADGILAVGGGSAIDTGKYASAQSGLPLVSIPTTYSGAEWTVFYGIRSPDRRMQGGGGGAQPVGIVYDVGLTLDLPRDVTAGTALNALAHCAEALYVKGRSP